MGVIFFHFNKAQKNENSRSSIFLSEEQIRWIDIQKMITKAKPDFSSSKQPNNKYQ